MPTDLHDCVSAELLADLSDQTDRQVRALADEGVVHKSDRGEYKLRESLRGMFQALRNQLHGDPAARARDKARIDRAEAESAEMRSAKEAGRLVLREDCNLIWRDAVAELRRKFHKSNFTLDQQKEIFAIINAVELQEPPRIT